MQNVEAIKSLVGAGLGASILPEHAVETGGKDAQVRVIRVGKRPLRR